MMTAPVIIVGAGPAGLALAAELALARVPVRILEKRAGTPTITRSFGVGPRTLELLDSRDMADEVIQRGLKVREVLINDATKIHLSRLPKPYDYLLIVPQSGTEEVLEKRCHELGVPIVRGAEVVGISQDEDGVTVEVKDADGTRTERASYVVGCDGAHSVVRAKIAMPFVGSQYDVRLILADVRLDDPPAPGTLFNKLSPHGIQLLIPFGDGLFRSILFLHGIDEDKPITFDDIRDGLIAVAGHDFGLAEVVWTARFLSERRQAAHYRDGRVFLAGDAAHVHSPVGAQGMNTGIGDAMNLGWKLAATVKGTGPSWLLDSYESERHPVGEAVLKVTDRVFRGAMIASPLRLRMMRQVSRVLNIEALQKGMRDFLAGIRASYPPRGTSPHKLAGHRAPGIAELAKEMRSGKFLLIDASPARSVARYADSHYRDRVAASAKSPVAGVPDIMLVRPDGYVAWAGVDAAQAKNALAEWCGGVSPSL